MLVLWRPGSLQGDPAADPTPASRAGECEERLRTGWKVGCRGRAACVTPRRRKPDLLLPGHSCLAFPFRQGLGWGEEQEQHSHQGSWLEAPQGCDGALVMRASSAQHVAPSRLPEEAGAQLNSETCEQQMGVPSAIQVCRPPQPVSRLRPTGVTLMQVQALSVSFQGLSPRSGPSTPKLPRPTA